MKDFLILWAFASAAYILFVGQFSLDEVAAAAACGFAASLWSTSLRRIARPRFRFERGAWAAAVRAMAGAPGAAGKVAIRLLQACVSGASGEIDRQTFIHGRLEDPADAGRRAVAVLARSLAPDSFVVRTPQGEDVILVHALVRTAAGDPRWAA